MKTEKEIQEIIIGYIKMSSEIERSDQSESASMLIFKRDIESKIKALKWVLGENNTHED